MFHSSASSQSQLRLAMQIASMLGAWDIQAMRLTCRGWHAAAAWAVDSLQPACPPGQISMPALAAAFPRLRSLDLRLTFQLAAQYYNPCDMKTMLSCMQLITRHLAQVVTLQLIHGGPCHRKHKCAHVANQPHCKCVAKALTQVKLMLLDVASSDRSLPCPTQSLKTLSSHHHRITCTHASIYVQTTFNLVQTRHMEMHIDWLRPQGLLAFLSLLAHR